MSETDKSGKHKIYCWKTNDLLYHSAAHHIVCYKTWNKLRHYCKPTKNYEY